MKIRFFSFLSLSLSTETHHIIFHKVLSKLPKSHRETIKPRSFIPTTSQQSIKHLIFREWHLQSTDIHILQSLTLQLGNKRTLVPRVGQQRPKSIDYSFLDFILLRKPNTINPNSVHTVPSSVSIDHLVKETCISVTLFQPHFPRFLPPSNLV